MAHSVTNTQITPVLFDSRNYDLYNSGVTQLSDLRTKIVGTTFVLTYNFLSYPH